MRCWIALVATVAVLASVSGDAAAVRIDREFHKSFDVQEGHRLVVVSGDGDLTITPWDEDAIDISVRYLADIRKVGFGGPPDFDVEFDSGGDFVRVRGLLKATGAAVFQSIHVHEYTYTIKAPPYVLLEIDGDDGDVHITDWRAEIDCSIDDGDLTLDGFEGGSLDVGVDDGDIHLVEASGDIEISADDGDVYLRGCAPVSAAVSLDDGDFVATACGGDFSVATDDGDITLDLENAGTVSVNADDGDIEVSIASGEAARVEVSADDGNVVVSLPGGASYSYMITTDDGCVRADLPERDEHVHESHIVRGKVRGGGPTVRIGTNDGDVVLLEG